MNLRLPARRQMNQMKTKIKQPPAGTGGAWIDGYLSSFDWCKGIENVNTINYIVNGYVDFNDLCVTCPDYPRRVHNAWMLYGNHAGSALHNLWDYTVQCLSIYTYAAKKGKHGISRCAGQIPRAHAAKALNYSCENNVSRDYNELQNLGMVRYIKGRRASRHFKNGLAPVVFILPPPGVSIDDLRDEKSPTHRVSVPFDPEELADH